MTYYNLESVRDYIADWDDPFKSDFVLHSAIVFTEICGVITSVWRYTDDSGWTVEVFEKPRLQINPIIRPTLW